MTEPESNNDRSARRNRIPSWVFALAGGAAYLLLGVLLWWALDQYIKPGDPTEKKDLVQALALIMAGVAGAGGVYFTWRGQRITQEDQKKNQQYTLQQLEQARGQLQLAQKSQEENQENAREQLEQARQSQEANQKNTQAQIEQSRNELAVSREGQITERFTSAIEQIGASSKEGKNLEIRLGGIHALERLSRESENDYWPIMEILSAYVREHAPLDPAAEADFDKGVAEADLDKGVANNDVLKRLSFRHAEADIQAILDTIGRRSRTFQAPPGGMKEESPLRIRLERTDLREATFFMANLTGVWFFRADLRGAYFRRCNLRDAAFGQANLENTVFEEVDLRVAVGLTQKQINQAFGYETELPDYLSKPAHWD